MSTSDNFPNWSIFKERKLPESLNPDIYSPAMEMSKLLLLYSGNVKKARQDIEEAYYEGLNIVAQQAVYVIQLEAALDNYEAALKDASLQRIHRHLRIIKDQMLSVLLQEGLEIIIPMNKPLDEIADVVHVEGWSHNKEFKVEMVAEVLEPIIYHRGNLIRMGRVIMGAPLE